jgi:hypothetical protein
MQAKTNADRWVIHPWLAPLLPLALLLSNNVGEASIGDSVRMGVVLEILVLGLYLAALRVFDNRHAAGLVCTISVMVLFVYEGLEGVLLSMVPMAWSSAIFWLLLLAHGGLVAGMILLLRRAKITHELTDILNKLVGGMLALNLVRYAWLVVPMATVSPPVQAPSEAPATHAVQLQMPVDPPDIYVILLDAYARQDVLKEIYGYDNSPFVSRLKALDFQVLSDARTNYPTTRLVVPSVMRGDYLDDIAATQPPQSMDIQPLIAETRRGPMVSSLREAGYRIVHIGSNISYTQIEADDYHVERVSRLEPSRYEWVALNMTILPDLFIRLSLPWAETHIHRRRVEHDLAALRAQGAARGGPKLVFAHIVTPHDPFVYGPNGEQRDELLVYSNAYTDEQNQAFMKAYRDQIHYVNGPILDAIASVVKDSERDPIVVIFGDHGLRIFWGNTAGDSCLQDSFGILHAVHLPGADKLPDTLSPVNIFRTIFDTTFGTELGLLPDRSFFVNQDELYDYVDVTDRVNTCGIPIPPPLD